MVAYNFKASFAAAIRAGTKRQTIRLPRARHARPGERLQLFTGMRTKNCVKIVNDPVCVGVDEVRIVLEPGTVVNPNQLEPLYQGIFVNGILLWGDYAEEYAVNDGFPSAEVMLRWWLMIHGRRNFQGIAIRWEPQA